MTTIMTNVGEWGGQVGDVWAQEWQRTDRSFTELNARLFPMISAMAPATGRAIDIGCGAAETAVSLAQTKPELDITGVDISPSLLEIARSRARGISNLKFVLGDAAAQAGSHAPFDLYYSRHGVMFFDDPVAAFTAFRHAASAEGRLIFSCFRDWSLNGFAYEIGNLTDDAAPTDAPGPFAFASQDRVAGILSASGWCDAEAIEVDCDYIAGQGEDPVGDAMSFMQRIGPAARAIRLAGQERRPAIVDGLRRICEDHRQGDYVLFPAAMWIWTARV
jgi:SAM-dependent methyltransferase